MKVKGVDDLRRARQRTAFLSDPRSLPAHSMPGPCLGLLQLVPVLQTVAHNRSKFSLIRNPLRNRILQVPETKVLTASTIWAQLCYILPAQVSRSVVLKVPSVFAMLVIAFGRSDSETEVGSKQTYESA